MMRRIMGWVLALALVSGGAAAQLPPDAVMLDKVKISELQKSHELDPVTLEAADPSLGTFEYEGVKYGMSAADTEATFRKDPSKYALQHDKARWEYNFTHVMSEIWCPVTDEISPGGNTKWTALGYSWESCCQFCNDTYTKEDFPPALERLKKRAAKAYDLIGGANYTEGASSPVEGAINFGGPMEDPAPAAEPVQVASAPDWLGDAGGDPTWASPMGKIVEKRCVSCHRTGGPAPMPFMTVGQVRQWKKNMKTHIAQGTMPPWPAAEGAVAYANSKRLTPVEKDLFLKWIDAGYPPGDEPYKIELGEWAIGEPDRVIELGEHVLAEDKAEHVAEYEVATGLDEDKWVVAAEIRPTDTFLTLEIDAGPLGAYHTGNGVVRLPEGHGFRLRKGEPVKIRVFYTKEAGWEEYDTDTKFALKFADGAADGIKEVRIDRLANDTFTLPAGSDSTTVSAAFTFPADGTVLSVNPVLRLRGKKVSVSIKYPDGKQEEILSIPHWDVNWHFRYEMMKLLQAPKGTIVTVTATYDNSDMNAQNPDPSADVKAGPGGELLEGWLAYTLDGPVQSAENRFGLTDAQLMAATGTCPECSAAAARSAVATD